MEDTHKKSNFWQSAKATDTSKSICMSCRHVVKEYTTVLVGIITSQCVGQTSSGERQASNSRWKKKGKLSGSASKAPQAGTLSLHFSLTTITTDIR